MPTPTAPPLASTIKTTIALTEQFLSSLAPDSAHKVPESPADTPSPLLLLSAAARSLKSQVTKLSLLTVNAPFTSSAVTTCLRALNQSILPSLVAATLLTTPESFSLSFSNECTSLARGTLRELLALVRLVDARSKDSNSQSDLSDAAKKDITEATGRVWERCDEIVKLSDEDVPGFIVRKSRQWLDLMKDAVKELQEWDPEEGLDEDLFGDAESDAESGTEDKENHDRATISAGVKDQALKVLSRIPQSVHVVLKQRLEKIRPPASVPLSAKSRSRLDQVLLQIRNVSELIDESAEGMYMGDLELCLKKAGEARALTIEIVEAVLKPLEEDSTSEETKETKEQIYIKRALEWIRQVDMNEAGVKARP